MATNSKHLALRNAIGALFTAGTPVAAKVTVGRRVPMADQDNEQVFVYLDTSENERGEIMGAPDGWSTRIRCEVCARAVAGVDAETRADAIATDAYSRVMLAGALAAQEITDLRAIGVAWSSDEAEEGLAVAQIVFELMHRTSADSIAT